LKDAFRRKGSVASTCRSRTPAIIVAWWDVSPSELLYRAKAMNRFDLEDFRKQLVAMKMMGSMRELISKIPGMGQMETENLRGVDADEEVKRIEGIIDSMTPAERRDPGLIDLSRRRRIAAGSSAEVSDVSSLIRQFDQMRSVMNQMGSVMDQMGRLRKGR
jgi:signal recognition particle subunit SRP54